jgi:uncharacterized protein
LFDMTWLPPINEWQSGLLPYPMLLAAQTMILALMAVMNTGVQRERGPLAIVSFRSARVVRTFSYVYFVAMVLRYVLTMAFIPERRWLGGVIPIVFHVVLALYLFVWSGHHLGRAASTRFA